MKSLSRILMLLALCGLTAPVALAASGLSGDVTDPQGSAVVGATISIMRQADSLRRQVRSDNQGHFSFAAVDAAEYRLTAECAGFAGITRTILVPENVAQIANIQFSDIASQTESVSVSADISDAGLFAPDPAVRILIRDETLDANPGRPGMPCVHPRGAGGISRWWSEAAAVLSAGRGRRPRRADCDVPASWRFSLPEQPAGQCAR